MNIENKVAIVTGGASGLGEATVRQYVKSGAKVAIFDMNEDRGKALELELAGNALFLKVNVANEDEVQQAVKVTVETFGALHIVNNYAGIAIAKKTVGRGEAHPLADYQKVINVNLVGTFNVARLAAEQMCKQEPIDQDGQRGVIINTASIAAYEGQIGQVAYSASKGGIVGMTLPMARDLASVGIRCNTIVPGLIHTPLADTLPEAAYDSLCASTLFPKRLGTPEEIANLAMFIVENNYINGESVRLDSGIRLQPK